MNEGETDSVQEIPINPGNGKPKGQPGRPSNAWKRAKALMELKEFLENGGTLEAFLGEQIREYEQQRRQGSDSPDKSESTLGSILGLVFGDVKFDDDILKIFDPLFEEISRKAGVVLSLFLGLFAVWKLEETNKVPPFLHLIVKILLRLETLIEAITLDLGIDFDEQARKTINPAQRTTEEEPAKEKNTWNWFLDEYVRGFSGLSWQGGNW